jgi:protein CpxP
MKRILIASALSLTLIAAASAQDAGLNASTPAPTRAIQRIERRLNVTDAERTQIKAILQQERPALTQLHTQREAERAEMAQLATFNDAQTRAILARYAQTNADVAVEAEKLRLELRAVLTPEQQQRLEQLRKRFGATVDDRLSTLGDNL